MSQGALMSEMIAHMGHFLQELLEIPKVSYGQLDNTTDCIQQAHPSHFVVCDRHGH